MLQQTQVKTVIPYYLNFIQAFPALQDLAAADLEAVLKLWEGLGYYARARNFHKAARIIAKERNGSVPDDLRAFKTLPGAGDYIACAVLSMAFGRPLAVVDGNVKRVLSRLFCIDVPVNTSISHTRFKEIADGLLDRKIPGTFNQAMMELGALICSPKHPQCTECPVSRFCKACISDRQNDFPVRKETKKIPLFHIAAGVVRKNGRLLITRRKMDGLLGGLWEFPGGKVMPHEDARSACIREIREETGIIVDAESHLTTIDHAYTHFKIRMDIFYCSYISGRIRLKGPIDHRWIRLSEISRFAFPKANLKFIPLIRE